MRLLNDIWYEIKLLEVRMNDLGKRLLFRLVRVILITGILMAALVMLHPDRYLPAGEQPLDASGAVQAGLLVAIAVLAVGVRLWLSQLRRKRAQK